MMNQVILIPKKNYIDEINALLIQIFSGELRRYYNFDETIDAFEQAIIEYFLNALTMLKHYVIR